MAESLFDAIIIGTGPAGISASLYLARAGYSVLALGSGPGALERAETIENYYGFPEPVSGTELVDRGLAQARRVGVEVRREEVVHVDVEDSFVVKAVALNVPESGVAHGAPGSGDESAGSAAREYRSKTLLLATGKSRAGIKAPGFEEFRGKGISFCATCDGFLYRGKKLAIIGAGEYAANEREELLAFSQDVMAFTDGKPVTEGTFPSGARIVDFPIERFEGTDRVSAIVTTDGTRHQIDGVFVAVGTAGAASFAATVGIAMNGQDIAVDKDFMTNVPGLFAAGDCVGGYLQIAKAVSDGALASKGMNTYLKSIKK